MTRILLEHIIHLILVLPIILFTIKNRKLETLKVLLVFSIVYILNSALLSLPLEFDALRIFNGNWNWSGKIFAVIGSIIFLLVYRKFELKDYFLTFKQDKKNLKKGIIIIVIILLVSSILDYTFNNYSREWNIETIMYQLTMPGINEEIVYRGILLGLLVKILKTNNIIHPGIIITALLFGMAHGLSLDNNFELAFNSGSFFGTMAMGMIWAWVTMKTGSIILALLSHNIGNVVGAVISMSR